MPKDEFVILLKPEIQKRLIVDALKEISKGNRSWGKCKRLAIFLHKKCKSFHNIKPNSLWDSYIFDWKSSKRYIPLDCVIELYKLVNYDLCKDDVLLVKYKISPNKSGVKFPFYYNEDLSFLGEAIKADGHIRKNLVQVNISNKNLIFLNKIERIIKNYVQENCIYKNLSIEIDIPKNKKVMEVIGENGKFKFRIHKASRSDKLKVSFYDSPDNLFKKYIIRLSDNSEIFVKVGDLNGEIISKSSYKIASTVLNLSICNMTFAKLLNILLEVPFGKKSDIIIMSDFLRKSPISVKQEAVNAILDTEAWIRNNRIRIGLNSRKYLEGLKDILKDFDIDASLEKGRSTLSINSVIELKKMAKYFRFSLDRKNNLLKNALNKRSSLKKGAGIILVLKILKGNRELSNSQISDNRNKHFDTIHQQLLKCLEKGFVVRNTKVWPYKYNLTNKGLKILNSKDKNEMYRN
ncbi:hypothetical protein CMI42_01705 [Candidatus Pacearchaeota archaeon]|nr:hypothetical protein [Candidatus Pacearchaeota archaeon]